jgi:hypothetical protein
MGVKSDLETAEAIKEHLKEVCIELRCRLSEFEKIIEHVNSKIKNIQGYVPKQSCKKIGEGK